MTETFGERLTKTLVNIGYGSATSKIGVQATPLAKHLGMSVQMVRKYITGDSIPDPSIVMLIADFAKVSPCWLLFGDDCDKSNYKVQHSPLDRKLWEAILSKIHPHLASPDLPQEKLNDYLCFAMDIYENIYHLDISFEDRMNMLELMIKSIGFSSKESQKEVSNS